MGGMKLPRFSLRTLLIGIALLSVPMGWVAYQINWIRQRHGFLQRPKVMSGVDPFTLRPVQAPWQLRPFRESGVERLVVPRQLVQEARSLFPEVVTVEPQDN